MAFDLEQVAVKRNIFLGILIAILVGSYGIGYVYQQNIDKEKEASVLFDDAWQKLYAILDNVQSQPNGAFREGDPNISQIKQLYTEVIEDVDTLVNDYQNTTAGIKAAILVKMVLPLSNVNALLDDQTLINEFMKPEYLEDIKGKHSDFWGAVVAVLDGVEAEQKFDFATAIGFYEEALTLDKKKYLQDFIIITIARNYEVLNDKESAMEYYQKIEDEYPNSAWLSFAMGKVYILSQQSLSDVTTELTNEVLED